MRPSPTRLALLLAGLPLLALAGCGGSAAKPAAGGSGSVAAVGPAAAQTATVIGTGSLKFSPATVTAKVGTLALTLGNEGGTPHNLVFDDKTLAKIPLVGAKQTKTAKYRFTKAGTYPFVCTIHSGMAGKVVVS